MLTQEEKNRIKASFDNEVEIELEDNVCISFAKIVTSTDDYPPRVIENAKQKAFETLSNDIDESNLDRDWIESEDVLSEGKKSAILTYLTQLNS